jgi:transcription antitermination factor NusB
MRKKTAARILAVQALYQADLRGKDFLAELDAFLRGSSEDEEVRMFAEDLVKGLLEKQDAVDAAIAGAAENWDVSRMAAVDRAILRLGVHELLHRPDVPPKVAIDEAIRLAKKFSTRESGAFVNGVMDKVMNAHLPPSARSPGTAT